MLVGSALPASIQRITLQTPRRTRTNGEAQDERRRQRPSGESRPIDWLEKRHAADPKRDFRRQLPSQYVVVRCFRCE